MLEAVHTAAVATKKFESLLKRAASNYERLQKYGLVEDSTLRRERVKELPEEEQTDARIELERYDKLVEDFEKFYASKPFRDLFTTYLGGEEPFVKWAEGDYLTVGYLGLREGSREYFVKDIRVEIPVDTLYKLYKLDRPDFPMLKIPTREWSRHYLWRFLANIKKIPENVAYWLIDKVYPSRLGYGFWSAALEIMGLEKIPEDVWEDLLEDWAEKAEEEVEKTPQYEELKKLIRDLWERRSRVADLVDEVKKAFSEKYKATTEDPEKVKQEFMEAVKAKLSERILPEEKAKEVFEEIKPLIPPEAARRVDEWIYEIRWAFLTPDRPPHLLASDLYSRFAGLLTTEKAREVAVKIMEKVRKIAPPPAPPVAKGLTHEALSRLREVFITILPSPTRAEDEKYDALIEDLKKRLEGAPSEEAYEKAKAEVEKLAKELLEARKKPAPPRGLRSEDIEKLREEFRKALPEPSEEELKKLEDLIEKLKAELAEEESEKALRVALDEVKLLAEELKAKRKPPKVVAPGACPLCGKPIEPSQPWTEWEGVRYHWECFEPKRWEIMGLA
jgi:hypothetical protein